MLTKGSRGCVPGAPDASVSAYAVHALVCLVRAQRREFISIIGRATVCELILSSTPEIWKEAQSFNQHARPKGRNELIKARKNPNHEAI